MVRIQLSTCAVSVNGSTLGPPTSFSTGATHGEDWDDWFESRRHFPPVRTLSGRGAGTFKLHVKVGGGQNRTESCRREMPICLSARSALAYMDTERLATRVRDWAPWWIYCCLTL